MKTVFIVVHPRWAVPAVVDAAGHGLDSTELAARGITAQVEHVELRDVAHEVLNMTLSGFASGLLKDVLEKVTAADGVIAVAPIFSASYWGCSSRSSTSSTRTPSSGRPVLVGATRAARSALAGARARAAGCSRTCGPMLPGPPCSRPPTTGPTVAATTSTRSPSASVAPVASSPRWSPTASRRRPCPTTRCAVLRAGRAAPSPHPARHDDGPTHSRRAVGRSPARRCSCTALLSCRRALLLHGVLLLHGDRSPPARRRRGLRRGKGPRRRRRPERGLVVPRLTLGLLQLLR